MKTVKTEINNKFTSGTEHKFGAFAGSAEPTTNKGVILKLFNAKYY